MKSACIGDDKTCRGPSWVRWRILLPWFEWIRSGIKWYESICHGNPLTQNEWTNERKNAWMNDVGFSHWINSNITQTCSDWWISPNHNYNFSSITQDHSWPPPCLQEIIQSQDGQSCQHCRASGVQLGSDLPNHGSCSEQPAILLRQQPLRYRSSPPGARGQRPGLEHVGRPHSQIRPRWTRCFSWHVAGNPLRKPWMRCPVHRCLSCTGLSPTLLHSQTLARESRLQSLKAVWRIPL